MSGEISERSTRLLLMGLKQERDVVLCRNRARFIADALHFDRQQQVRIATAVSEIARNALCYARQATAEFLAERTKGEGVSGLGLSFVVVVRDQGPGIGDLPSILAGNYQSGTGLGAGILGAKRLLDSVQIKTGSAGTTVRLEQRLPKSVDLKSLDLQSIVAEVNRSAKVELLDEFGAQNQALVTVLDQLNVKNIELQSFNEELDETNRGVIALYDELDTVQRVGRVVASKLDLGSLLQAITDATVEVSGAECAGFFRKEPLSKRLSCQTVSGPLGVALQNCFLNDVRELASAGTDISVLRIDDLATYKGPFPLNQHLPIRSFLALAVRDSAEEVVGALVFAHRSPAMFTERTERILTVVAVQVSMGLANAELYRTAQAASAARDQFLAILSHELRTPLTPIVTVLATMERDTDLPEKMRSDLQMVRRNLQLEAQLIDDLLDLTHITRGKITLRNEVVDVHSVIQSVSRLCQGGIDKQQLNFEMHLEASQYHVLGDSGRIQQVLWNLLNNAIKFATLGGKIELRTSVVAGTELRFQLADDGRGIEPESLQRIFQPFEQGHVSVHQFGGLGLGLAISKFIIDAQHGKIWAESAGLGKGAIFTILLPLAKFEQAEAVAAPKLKPAVSGTARILLVDDHKDTLDAMSRFLARGGYEVVTASTFQQGLSVGRREKFDLLISDLGLGDGSGYELMSALRAVSSIKGIALSGYGMKSDFDRSMAAGFSAHLVKPCSPSVLNAAIERILLESES